MKTSRSLVLLALFAVFGFLGCGSTGSSVSASAGSAALTEANVRRTLDAFVSRNGGSFEYIGVRELQSGTEAVADLRVKDMIVGRRVFSGQAAAVFAKYKGDLGDRWVLTTFKSAADPFTDTAWININFPLVTTDRPFVPAGLSAETIQPVLDDWIRAGGEGGDFQQNLRGSCAPARRAVFNRMESQEGTRARAIITVSCRQNLRDPDNDGPARAEFVRHLNGVWTLRRIVGMNGTELWGSINIAVGPQLGS